MRWRWVSTVYTLSLNFFFSACETERVTFKARENDLFRMLILLRACISDSYSNVKRQLALPGN